MLRRFLERLAERIFYFRSGYHKSAMARARKRLGLRLREIAQDQLEKQAGQSTHEMKRFGHAVYCDRFLMDLDTRLKDYEDGR